MHPTELSDSDIAAYIADGHWTRETIVDRYRAYADAMPDQIACQDADNAYTWHELDELTDRVAANLIRRKIARDARAMVQIASSTKEIVLRIAFKKAGIIAAFVPLQWRQLELTDVLNRLAPSLVVLSTEDLTANEHGWIQDIVRGDRSAALLGVDLSPAGCPPWLSWKDLVAEQAAPMDRSDLRQRAFRYDEISLVTASSGTSGLSKLCEWPEAAQLCIGRAIAHRLRVGADDHIGIFSPMAGAAGLLVWLVSGGVPCRFLFPQSYQPDKLLTAVENHKLTVVTTVPVVLNRMARMPLGQYDLSTLRCLRVGTGAANLQSARHFESHTGCRVIVASGSMECPGFGHADFEESRDARLNGSVGFALPGGRLRICDEHGNVMPADEAGELQVRAPFAATGYWDDSVATHAAWSQGWYKTGDVARFDADGRLRLLGRLKELINCSGHKILPAEVEQALLRHPNVVDCSVVGAPDDAYGSVPWAFVHLHDSASFDVPGLVDHLRECGMATYKIPKRFIQTAELPRINDNKVDKRLLLQRELDGESG